MIGMMAFSKAGHDRRTIYMIVAEDESNVYLCDGKIRTIDRPKKKNLKHIQLIKAAYDPILAERLKKGEPVRDEEIKRAIKVFMSKEVKDV